MYNGMTTKEFADEMFVQQGTRRDFIAPAMTAEFTNGNLFLDGDKHQTTATADGHLARMAGLPTDYFRKLLTQRESDGGELTAARKLVDDTFNFWMHRAGLNDKNKMFRTFGRGNSQDGDTPVARAVLSDRYLRIDNDFVADVTVTAMPDATAHRQYVDSDRMTLTMTLPMTEMKLGVNPKVDDIVKLGLTITNNEVGGGSLSVSPMLYRLVCTNGMSIPESPEHLKYRRSHSGSQIAPGVISNHTQQKFLDARVSEFKDVVAHYANPETMRRIADDLTEQGRREVDNPTTVIQELSKIYSLDAEQLDRALSTFHSDAHETGRTVWGVSNAFTGLANHASSLAQAEKLEQAGGDIMRMPTSQIERLVAMAEAA